MIVTKDIETIDSSLAGSIQSVNSSLAAFFASIITIACVMTTKISDFQLNIMQGRLSLVFTASGFHCDGIP